MMVCMKNKSDDIELTLENREYQLINLKRLDNFRGKKNIMLEKLEKKQTNKKPRLQIPLTVEQQTMLESIS